MNAVAPLPPEWLASLLRGERVPVWQAEWVAREALGDEARGMSWVRALVLDERVADRGRAAAGKVLATSNDAATLEVLCRALVSSNDPWGRFVAAEALRAARRAEAIPFLVTALGDDFVLSDMWAVFRVSDAAALALAALALPEALAALSPFRESRRAEARGGDRTSRDLAIYVLAELGDAEGILLLEEQARDPDELQAIDLLKLIRGS